MNADEFDKYVIDKRQERIDAIEAKMKADEDARILFEANEKIKKEAADKAKADAEAKAAQDIIDAEKRHQEEINKLKQEQQQKELDAIKQKEAEVKAKIEQQEKLEKQKKYQQWLKENNFNESEYIIVDFPPFKKVMFKKVSEFTI
jgi:translation initiation factor IF-2